MTMHERAHRLASGDTERICEWCGDTERQDDPVTPWIMSPPVNGHRIEVAHMHQHCATEAAAFEAA